MIEDYRQSDPNWLSKVARKKGVILETLKPEALQALECALYVYSYYGKKLTVTSTNDGKHMAASQHYKNQAFDTRTWNIDPKIQMAIVEKCRKLLGRDYDILIEPTHIHFEYDPK